MSSEIKANSIKDKTGTRQLASDSGSAWTWGSGLPKGSVIEQFLLPCTNSSATVQSGTYTSEDVTAIQELTESLVKINGSLINYTPPTGTSTVIYEFNFQVSHPNAQLITHFSIFLDDDSGTPTEITNFKTTIEGQDSYPVHRVILRYPIIIGGSYNASTGQVSTWSSARTIQVKGAEYTSDYQGKVHFTGHWHDGSGVFTCPVIGITALA